MGLPSDRGSLPDDRGSHKTNKLQIIVNKLIKT
jgi:hypothetical protein